MDKKIFEAFAREAAKSIKTESDLEDFRKTLTKVSIETALNIELNEHLGYKKQATTTTENARIVTLLNPSLRMMSLFSLRYTCNLITDIPHQ